MTPRSIRYITRTSRYITRKDRACEITRDHTRSACSGEHMRWRRCMRRRLMERHGRKRTPRGMRRAPCMRRDVHCAGRACGMGARPTTARRRRGSRLSGLPRCFLRVARRRRSRLLRRHTRHAHERTRREPATVGGQRAADGADGSWKALASFGIARTRKLGRRARTRFEARDGSVPVGRVELRREMPLSYH